MSSTQTYSFNFSRAATLKPLVHDMSILHTNVKIGIWTLKVFIDTNYNTTDDDADNKRHEVQIFRGEDNVRDTPFADRTFFDDISKIDEFINKFDAWANMSAYVSFDNLEFVEGVAVISKLHPGSEDWTCIVQITERPEKGYYDLSYFETETDSDESSHPFPKFKYLYFEKDTVTHYMRWFAQWIEYYHRTKSQFKDYEEIPAEYLSWLYGWTHL